MIVFQVHWSWCWQWEVPGSRTVVPVPSAPTHCDWFPLQPCGEDLPFTSCFQNDALHSYCRVRQQACEGGKLCPCSSALDISLGCSCHAPVCLISSQLQCLLFTGIWLLVQQAHFLVVGIVKPLSARQTVWLHDQEETKVLGLMFGACRFLSHARSDGGGRWPKIVYLIVLGQTLGLKVEITPQAGNCFLK